MRRLILAISVFGLLISQVLISGISYAAPALDQNAKSGFEKGIKDSGGSSEDTVTVTIQNVINLLIFIAGIIAVIYILIGGIRYVLSNGDSGAAKKARDNILYALIGLVVAVSAYSVVNLILFRVFEV